MSSTRIERPLILHAHLFKNAGSTFDWSLRRQFGDAFLDHRDDAAMRDNPDYLEGYLRDNTRISALSSHWLPLPLRRKELPRAHLCLLIRHPLERALSVYNFERRQDADGPGNRQARALPFADYVRWRLEPGVGPALRNFHTRYLSGRYFNDDMEQSFDRAVSLLEATPLVGLVDRYALSMALFEQGLKADFPTIDLSFEPQNTSQPAGGSLDERLARLAASLGPVLELLERQNQHDLRLYQLVDDRIRQLLAANPGLQQEALEIERRSGAVA